MIIASCTGNNCEIRDSCERYTSMPDTFEECLAIMATNKLVLVDGCGFYVDNKIEVTILND